MYAAGRRHRPWQRMRHGALRDSGVAAGDERYRGKSQNQATHRLPTSPWPAHAQAIKEWITICSSVVAKSRLF
jgi:hypothetical protein